MIPNIRALIETYRKREVVERRPGRGYVSAYVGGLSRGVEIGDRLIAARGPVHVAIAVCERANPPEGLNLKHMHV